jgi:hypothetical protein
VSVSGRTLSLSRGQEEAPLLDGRPAVFLSCSERYKKTVAWPVRDALTEYGVHGIIVSDEPLLPRTPSDPDSQVNAYLDASDALVALCTPDDRLEDGTVQTRPNIINEIQRALDRPGLRNRVQVLKAPDVRLPSNITPTHDALDVADIAAAVDRIVPQLRVWGVLSREPEPAPAPSTTPATIDDVIEGLGLGDDEKISTRAYAIVVTETRESQITVVDRIARFLVANDTEDNTPILIAGAVLEAMNRLDLSLVSPDIIEQLANNRDFSTRSVAAHLLWDRADVAPDLVPLGLLARLAIPAGEDWYVQAPAMAAVKQLLLRRRPARMIFDDLARNKDSDNRYAAAAALLEVARVDPRAVPGDLAERLAEDKDEQVAGKAAELLDLLRASPTVERDHLSPFGL